MTSPVNLNVLHLSDLHYKSDRAHDQGVVISALLEDIGRQSSLIGPPDLIVFSGDLVHSADDNRAYENLFDAFIEPLLQKTNCDFTRLFLCPGNHDLSRKQLIKNKELQGYIESSCETREQLNEHYLNGSAQKLAKEKFNDFFDFAEFFDPEGELYRDEIVSVYEIEDLSLTIINLNTAWLGRGGIENVSDLQKLAVPEAALTKALAVVNDEFFTIVNFHHPLNWHMEHSSQDFQDLVRSKVNLFLCGHVHDPRPMVAVGQSGGTIHNQSGALYTWRKDRYLGYSNFRISPRAKLTELTWRSYFDRRRTFDIATNIDDGTGRYYSSDDARIHFSRIIDGARSASISTWISEEVLPPYLDSAIESILDKPTSELFVTPPLSRLLPAKSIDDEIEGAIIEEDVRLEDIIADEQNYIIESYPEHGKTSLLIEICRQIATNAQFANNSRKAIPIHLPFSIFVPGTKRVEKAIRDRLPGTPPGCDLDVLLKEGCFAICVDDVVYGDAKRIKELRDFVGNYKANRFIITVTTFRHHERLISNENLGAHFEHVRLHQLRRPDLRKLIRKIDETNGSEEELLNRVIKELRAINVPATPLNSSLLTDILSRDSTFSPLNRPSLIERFIETLLKKRSIGEVERKRFDFRNQVHYLGHIAEYMCRRNSYKLRSDDLYKVTLSYLESLGFNFTARDIIENAISSKIFTENKSDNTVYFRFRAFLEFFIASKMRDDPDFREWIFDEDRYLSYLNEIEYYSGLERNNLKLLQIVSKRHLQHHISIFGVEFDNVVQNSQFKSFPTSLEGSKKFAEELAEQLKEAPLTAEERDEVLDAEIPRDAEGRQEVFRPSPKDASSKYMLSLFMYTNLVKNTELIEDTEKRYHLSCVLRSWSSTILASFLSIPSLVKNRKMTINGLTYIVSFPLELSDEEVARRIALNLPKEIARLIHLLVGTEKLENQLGQTTSIEAGEPNVTSFLRSALYIDLQLRGWWREPGKFISSVHGDNFFQEVMLSKAADVYKLGSFNKQVGNELEDEIVETFARLYAPSQADIQKIRNRKKASMRLNKNIRSIRAKLPGQGDD
ncbi:metallophosphoesterase [Palleronia sp. LCG004]|uniref:metallophosphoesterase n=1 Tax=Palleronia sp. LCG004 TaxID=3079304 RepID=UPI00294208FE|nr:metallophosphoesterase [Palleronia sp. LCG004]WOI56838.1 metallophosphoesterase [Palleronia sp. LCG004]